MTAGMSFDPDQPIFRQLARRIEQGIIDGTYPEGTQIPSTNEFAAFLRINPATAKKAVSLLMDDEFVVKRRGIGMFVADGARERLLMGRRETFTQQYIQPLLTEARRLGIEPGELAQMISASAATLETAAETTARTTPAESAAPASAAPETTPLETAGRPGSRES